MIVARHERAEVRNAPCSVLCDAPNAHDVAGAPAEGVMGVLAIAAQMKRTDAASCTRSPAPPLRPAAWSSGRCPARALRAHL